MYFTDEFKAKRVGGWCAAIPKNQWLQVDLGVNRYITAVGTQGRLSLNTTVGAYPGFCSMKQLGVLPLPLVE